MDNLSIFLDSKRPTNRAFVGVTVPPLITHTDDEATGAVSKTTVLDEEHPTRTQQQQQQPALLVISNERKSRAPLLLTMPVSPVAVRLAETQPTDADEGARVETRAVATVAVAVAAEQVAAGQVAAGQPASAQPVAEPTVAEQVAAEQPTDTQSAAQPVPSAKHKRKKRRRTKANAKTLFLVALRDVCIALVLLTILLQFFTPTIVREHSMENTLKENEVLYIAKKAYWFGSPQHGDIVVFHTQLTDENGAEKSLVKRVIGLPGDRISINGATVFRNGMPLDEPYLKSGQTPGDMSEVLVPANSYFVLGDNREVSNDSRNAAVGFIEKKQLQGKVVLRIFPLSDFRTF